MCSVHLLDSHFIADASKFLSGTLVCLSAMMQLQLPHINVMSKMDLLGKKAKKDIMDLYFDCDVDFLKSELHMDMGERFYQLNEAIGNLVSRFL
jgi:hypothetical protein